jgi:hypothetical protein
MSDYMVAQSAVSFSSDMDLEIVTKDKQKLALASSATVFPSPPDKIHVICHGGFADVEAIFDGMTLSLIGRNADVYGRVQVPAQSTIPMVSCGTNIIDQSQARICFSRICRVR